MYQIDLGDSSFPGSLSSGTDRSTTPFIGRTAELGSQADVEDIGRKVPVLGPQLEPTLAKAVVGEAVRTDVQDIANAATLVKGQAVYVYATLRAPSAGRSRLRSAMMASQAADAAESVVV